jgi:hypothetical protein
MGDLHWSVWGFVQHAKGNPAEDFWSYGLERLGRSKARMSGADFGRHLSVVDPEMRCGHKSKRQAWAGYKVHIAEEPESELITEVGVRPANEYDADAASPIMERQKESTGLRPKELLCDGAYGSADVRAKLGELGVRVVAKLRPLTDAKHFRKDEFEIDLRANDGEGSVSCPSGVTTTDYRMARDGW